MGCRENGTLDMSPDFPYFCSFDSEISQDLLIIEIVDGEEYIEAVRPYDTFSKLGNYGL